MNAEANFISPLEQGVFPKALLLFTIIWVEKKPHVGAVLTVLVFDVTSCFETTAEPYGLWIITLLCPLQSQPSTSTFLRLLSPPLSSCFVALVITATSSHSCRLVNEILLRTGSSLWFGFFLYKCDERESRAKREFCHPSLKSLKLILLFPPWLVGDLASYRGIRNKPEKRCTGPLFVRKHMIFFLQEPISIQK